MWCSPGRRKCLPSPERPGNGASVRLAQYQKGIVLAAALLKVLPAVRRPVDVNVRNENSGAVSAWPGQFHRRLSFAFTAALIANFVARAKGIAAPWVSNSLPLSHLRPTNLCPFALP